MDSDHPPFFCRTDRQGSWFSFAKFMSVIPNWPERPVRNLLFPANREFLASSRASGIQISNRPTTVASPLLAEPARLR